MLHRQLWSTAASLVATVALLATGLWLVHAGGTAAPPAAAAGQPAAPAVKPASAPVATAPAPAAPATAAPAAAPAKLTGEVSYTSTIEVQTAKLTLKAETEVFIKRPDFLLLRVRTDQHECEIVRQGQQVHVRHAREEAFAAGPDWPATRARILEHVPAALRPAVIAALVTIDTATKGATFDQNFYANYAGVAFRALFEMGGLGPESEAKSYDLAIHGRDSILAAGSGVTPDGDGLFIKEFQISWDAAVKGAQPPAVPATPGGGAAATARQPAASWQEALHNVRVSRELVPFLAVLEASYAAPKDLAKELQTLKVTGIAWDKTPVADAIADLGDKIAAAHPDGARIPILLLTEFAEAKRNLPPVTATFRQATVAEVLTVLCRDAQLRLEVGEDKILLF